MITIQELEDKITLLRLEVDELKTYKGQLQYPANTESKSAVSKLADEFLPDKIIDTVWNKYLYLFDDFSSMDGWSITGTTLVTPQIAFGQLIQHSGTASVTSIEKYINAGNLFTFAHKQRFRTDVAMNAHTTGSAFIVVGSLAAGDSYYGFEINNGRMFGISSNQGTTTVTLPFQTLTLTQVYQLEARLDYRKGIIIFYVDGVQKATITSNLPKQDLNTKNFGVIWTRKVQAGTGIADISLFGSYFEMILSRDTN